MLAYDIQEKFFKTVDQSKIKVVKYELQPDFFKTLSESEIERLVRIVDEVKTSMGAVRRKLFAENGTLKKKMNEVLEENNSLKALVLDLSERLEIIERNICYGH